MKKYLAWFIHFYITALKCMNKKCYITVQQTQVGFLSLPNLLVICMKIKRLSFVIVSFQSNLWNKVQQFSAHACVTHAVIKHFKMHLRRFVTHFIKKVCRLTLWEYRLSPHQHLIDLDVQFWSDVYLSCGWGSALGCSMLPAESVCHSPWQEPMFRATNDRNHIRSHNTSFCSPHYGLQNEKGKKKNKGLQWRKPSASTGDGADMRGSLFVRPDIYLSKAKRQRRRLSTERSPGSAAWY